MKTFWKLWRESVSGHQHMLRDIVDTFRNGGDESSLARIYSDMVEDGDDPDGAHALRALYGNWPDDVRGNRQLATYLAQRLPDRWRRWFTSRTAPHLIQIHCERRFLMVGVEVQGVRLDPRTTGRNHANNLGFDFDRTHRCYLQYMVASQTPSSTGIVREYRHPAINSVWGYEQLTMAEVPDDIVEVLFGGVIQCRMDDGQYLRDVRAKFKPPKRKKADD